MSPPSLEATLALALGKHWGQVDKAGAPYILHPIRVMLRMKGDDERRVALLHDVVEDCGVSREQLVAMGYPRREVEAVLALTKLPAEEDDYPSFIRRVSTNPLAARVKLGDLEDNLDLSRLKRVDAKAKKRLEKYEAAKTYLTQVIGANLANREPDTRGERTPAQRKKPSSPAVRGDAAALTAIKGRLHDLIRQRCAEGQIPVPDPLPSLTWTVPPEAWFAVPGMAGGFTYS